MSELRRSVCPYDCPDACGLLVEVEDGRARRVLGDPDHPYCQGLLCPKMNHYERTVHSERRLTLPLRRRGAKGRGEFVPVSWDEALAEIAERWRGIIAADGAEAILPYSYAGTMGLLQRNAGHAFFHRLGASRLIRSICSTAKDVGLKAVLGETAAPHPDEVLESDLVLLWGINAAATSIHFLHRVRAAKARGAAVWLIDTWRTQTAPMADRVFTLRPGSDGALAMGLMHILVRDGLHDRSFLLERVQGFDELAEKVLPDYPPDVVSRLTGLSEREIEEMAAAYGRARTPFIRLGSGLCRYANGSMTVRCIAALPALTGAYGRRGAGLFGGVSTGGAFAMQSVLREDLLPGPTRQVNMNRLGEVLTVLNDPPVRSLYVYHSNPAAIAPDQNRVLAGLAREDLFTVVHERFLTDTARYADLVLPATSSLEHPDLYRSYGHYGVQRVAPVIPPVGESLSNWEVFTRLAAVMGFGEPCFRRTADEMLDDLLAASAGLQPGVDAAALAAGQPQELTLLRDPAAPFATPSGKIELLNPAEPEPLPRYLSPHGGDYPLKLMTAPALGLLNSSFCERDDLRQREGGMLLKLSPVDAAARGIRAGQSVLAWNELGEVVFNAAVSEDIPEGVAVAEGAWWIEFAPGERTVNALTSQRLTDRGAGSTFYDNTIDVRPLG